MSASLSGTILATLFTLVATSANAQGWQGPYIGFHLGGAAVDFSNDRPLSPGVSGDTQEFLGGIQLGYNWQRGQSVLGAEADISLTNISDQFAGGQFEEDMMTSVRVRAGFTQGETLIFGSVGVAWTDQQTTLTGVGSSHDLEAGMVLGAGAERFLGENVSGRVEAYVVDAPSATRTIGGTTTANGSQNVVFRAGLSLHF